MSQKITLNNMTYLSSSEAAKLAGYTSDYITQLARKGKIEAQRVGRLWYVEENALRLFLDEVSQKKEERTENLRKERIAERNGSESLVLTKTSSGVGPVPERPLHAPVFVQKASAMLVAVVLALSVYSFGSLVNQSNFDFRTTGAAQVGEMSETLRDSLEALAVSMYSLLTIVERTETVSVDDVSVVPEIPEQSVEPTPKAPQQRSDGVVAFPSSGDSEEDELSKMRIKGSFSDEVEIYPDATGRSGIIRPVFKDQSEDEYVYVLVPVTP